MKISIHPKPIPVLFLFTVGVLLAILLSAIAAWGDYEAASYGFPNRSTTLLDELKLSDPDDNGRKPDGLSQRSTIQPTDRSPHPHE